MSKCVGLYIEHGIVESSHEILFVRHIQIAFKTCFSIGRVGDCCFSFVDSVQLAHSVALSSLSSIRLLPLYSIRASLVNRSLERGLCGH